MQNCLICRRQPACPMSWKPGAQSRRCERLQLAQGFVSRRSLRAVFERTASAAAFGVEDGEYVVAVPAVPDSCAAALLAHEVGLGGAHRDDMAGGEPARCPARSCGRPGGVG